MHCSLEFAYLGLPVAAHSQWNEARTQCTLHLFTDHQGVLNVLPELPREEAQGLARCMMHCGSTFPFPNETDAGTTCIQGVAALTLTNFLVLLQKHAHTISRVANEPDLMGYWEPLRWRAPGPGIILWFHPDDGYRAVIAHAKNQALDVIREKMLEKADSIRSLHSDERLRRIVNETDTRSDRPMLFLE